MQAMRHDDASTLAKRYEMKDLTPEQRDILIKQVLKAVQEVVAHDEL